MMRIPCFAAIVVGIALGSLGCDRARNGDPAPTTKPPASVAAEDADAGRVGDASGAEDAAAGCVEACVARNQMRAVAIEQIRADCRAECEK